MKWALWSGGALAVALEIWAYYLAHHGNIDENLSALVPGFLGLLLGALAFLGYLVFYVFLPKM